MEIPFDATNSCDEAETICSGYKNSNMIFIEVAKWIQVSLAILVYMYYHHQYNIDLTSLLASYRVPAQAKISNVGDTFLAFFTMPRAKAPALSITLGFKRKFWGYEVSSGVENVDEDLTYILGPSAAELSLPSRRV